MFFPTIDCYVENFILPDIIFIHLINFILFYDVIIPMMLWVITFMRS